MWNLKIVNNPIDILLKVFEENYPEIARKIKTIEFAKINKGYAATDFADDGTIRIYIGTKKRGDLTVEIITELLAHELAHAIAGIEAGHGQAWGKYFDKLHDLYIKESKEVYETLCHGKEKSENELPRIY